MKETSAQRNGGATQDPQGSNFLSNPLATRAFRDTQTQLPATGTDQSLCERTCKHLCLEADLAVVHGFGVTSRC